jgi:ketosteroid isomerase-like protein
MKPLIIVISALLVAACDTSTSPAKQVAEEVFEAFNAHDWQRMEDLYADNVEMMDPAFEGIKRGKEGMTDFYRSVSDIHDEVKMINASGDIVVVEFVSTGTIDGQAFTLPICTVFRIENSKVVSDHTYYDKN